MEEEKAALEAEIQQREAELNQLTEDIERAEGDEKQALEDQKAAIVADLEGKKARLDELTGVPPDDDPPPPDPTPRGSANDDPPPPDPTPRGSTDDDPPAPKPSTLSKPDSGKLTREQMMKILQDRKATVAAQLPQDGSTKSHGDDMEKWLITLKHLKKDGIISESDVKVENVEKKIKSHPVEGELKKMQDEIDEIDKIINIQEEKEFQEEFSRWYEKNQHSAAGTGGSPQKKPDAQGNVLVPDANVLAQLKEAEARAARAVTEVEALKNALAEYAHKETMTADDIKDMEEKQKLLMDKMAEFEEITKMIQSLIGLTDTPSSQLGFQPSRDGDKAGGPEDNLPKVIICGTGDIDTVPKIIICETSEERDGQKPVFQEVDGPARERPGMVGGQSGLGGYPNTPGVPGGFPRGPGGPGGFPSGPGDFGFSPGRSGGFVGYPGGIGVAGAVYAGGPHLAAPFYPGGPSPIYPGGPGGVSPMYPGGPGGALMHLDYAAGPNSYPGFSVPYTSTIPGVAQPRISPVPPCLDYYNKSKENKKKKKKKMLQPEMTSRLICPGMDCWGPSACRDRSGNDREKKREKVKRCFCQLAGFCPKD